jgi:hypothetical protein
MRPNRSGGRSLRQKWGAAIALIGLLMVPASLLMPPTSTAAQPPKKKVVSTAIEAWYHSLDTPEEVPLPGLPVVPDPVNPYGEDTLHVGITGGQENSRTYLTLALKQIPPNLELKEATLILPIDPDDATMSADAARIQVCLSIPPAKNTEGSFDQAPEVDCSTKVPATYVKKPRPHLVADLTKFGDELTFSALALVPSDKAVEQGDTWHVAFYGKKNKAKEARSISAVLRYGTIEVAPDAGDTPTTDVPSTSIGGGTDVPSGPVSGGPAEAPSEETPVAAAEAQPVSSLGPSYKIVWSLPLMMLGAFLYFGSALTREVVLSPRRVR